VLQNVSSQFIKELMATMKAIQITELTGPQSALQLVDAPEPQAGTSHPMTPGEGIIVEVHAAGVSFPELLQTRGEYQLKPDLPFIPGSEVGGIVRSAPVGAAVKAGDRVAAFCLLGAFAEVVVAPPYLTFPLPDSLGFAQGASLVLNYHTVYFSLVTRGRLQPGETVLVHGAAGGIGTAALQVAKGLGARTIAVVSTDAKAEVARAAGADHILRSDGPWRDQAKEIGGVDVVLDPVGGADRFTDSLRSLKEGGRVVIVGFTESIPSVKVNRLLLANTELIGAGWGAYAVSKPLYVQSTAEAVGKLVAEGAIDPIIGARFPLERASDALSLLESRGATGKVVLDIAN
jgi:NADPH:quinone reductase